LNDQKSEFNSRPKAKKIFLPIEDEIIKQFGASFGSTDFGCLTSYFQIKQQDKFEEGGDYI
jgi:hypothetical protein